MIEMNENDKNEIVKRVLQELKDKKLLDNHRTSKSAYLSTEKMLYSLTVLPEAMKLLEDEIKQLEQERTTIVKAPAKSSNLILNDKSSTYVYGDEILETRISELKQTLAKSKSRIRIVEKALNKIQNEKYYPIIVKYYFENKTIPTIAEELDCSIGTISENKKKLMNKLKVYIFPDTFMEEL